MEENRKNEKYLPIGTICRLKGGKKYVMVSGFCPISENSEKIHDYFGIAYPEGIITSDVTLYFDHNQIEEIIYMGYSNDEDKEFKSKLKDLIENEIPKISGDLSSSTKTISNDLFKTDNN